MLVKELRKELEKYNKKDLEKIIIELYKRIPNSKKENYKIDEFIKDININKKTNNKSINFEDLQKEVLYFISCVKNGYYASPNRIVSKKERSSWRFKVKRYYKELNSINIDSSNYGKATILLIELYKILSDGVSTTLFVTWETFSALGISQKDFYDAIIKRILYNGYNEKNIKICIELLDVPKTVSESEYDMFDVFIGNLKNVDTKELAIRLLKQKVNSLREELAKEKSYCNRDYLRYRMNGFVECTTKLFINLCEVDESIDYFCKNYCIGNSFQKIEDKLLEFLYFSNLKDLWCKVYEKYKDQVDFPVGYKKIYQEFKEEM